MTKPGVPCHVVGCDISTRSARKFQFEGRLVWMMVCREHWARLEAGEAPVLVSRPFDLADGSGNRPSLMMEDPPDDCV